MSVKNLNKDFKFDDGIGWLKFNFKTKSWWFYTNDGIPYNTKKFQLEQAVYLIQLTKKVVAQVDGYNSTQVVEEVNADN